MEKAKGLGPQEIAALVDCIFTIIDLLQVLVALLFTLNNPLLKIVEVGVPVGTISLLIGKELILSVNKPLHSSGHGSDLETQSCNGLLVRSLLSSHSSESRCVTVLLDLLLSEKWSHNS
jgi:hypothetical protein